MHMVVYVYALSMTVVSVAPRKGQQMDELTTLANVIQLIAYLIKLVDNIVKSRKKRKRERPRKRRKKRRKREITAFR